MKYSFKQIDEDTINLTYKDKVFPIHKDVELLSKIQGINAKARAKMSMELKKQGMTINDLIVIKHEGNKTIEDHSNVDYIEKEYYNLACVDLVNELCQKYFEMSLDDVVVDIGIETDTELVDFTQDLLVNIAGKNKSPREEK